MRLKVAVDLLSTISAKNQGRGAWVSMLKHYADIGPDIGFYVFVTPALKEFYASRLSRFDNIHFIDVSFRGGTIGRLLFQEVSIPRFCRNLSIDIHYTCSPAPVLNRFPSAQVWRITALQFFHFPKQVGNVRAQYHRLTFGSKARNCSAIVANSEYTRSEILRFSNVSPDKVFVIHDSVDHNLFNTEFPLDGCRKYIKNRLRLELPYILWVSDIRPYKNPIPFLTAFKEVVQKWKLPHRVIMIGNDIFGYREEVKKTVVKLGISDRVIFLDGIPRDDLRSFYRCADLFVYPSSLETFGIPPLEAMACGTPVIASNQSAVPEIVRDAALVIDPKNTGIFANAILTVLTQQSVRSRLIQMGLRRAQEFSWEKNAQQTIRLFEDVVNSG